MNILKYFFCSIFVLSVVSCATTGEVEGEGGLEKMFQSKRYKDAVKERDSLLALTRSLQTDTFRLGNQNKTFLKEIKRINGEYAFLKKDYAALDSQCTVLNAQYTALMNEQARLKTEYNSYADSMEKKFSTMSDELRYKSDELNPKTNDLNKSDELKSKSNELNVRTTELSTKPDELTGTAKITDLSLSRLEKFLSEQDSFTRDLYNSVSKAYSGYNPDDLSISMTTGKVHLTINNKLLFKPGSMIIDENGRKTLKKLALLLLRYEDLDVSIEGHTDSIPIKNISYKDNWGLSAVRATTVARFLQQDYDIIPDRLVPIGRGEFFPIASNEDVQGRAKNKRIEFILSSDLDDIYRELEK